VFLVTDLILDSVGSLDFLCVQLPSLCYLCLTTRDHLFAHLDDLGGPLLLLLNVLSNLTLLRLLIFDLHRSDSGIFNLPTGADYQAAAADRGSLRRKHPQLPASFESKCLVLSSLDF